MALCLQQVAQLEHHRARLVEDRQVEHTGFRTPLAGGVEPPQFALDRVRNGLEKTVAHREHQVDVAEVVGREHGVDAAVDRLHFVAHADQIGRLFAGQPFVVVVDMATIDSFEKERKEQFSEVIYITEYWNEKQAVFDDWNLTLLLERREARKEEGEALVPYIFSAETMGEDIDRILTAYRSADYGA